MFFFGSLKLTDEALIEIDEIKRGRENGLLTLCDVFEQSFVRIQLGKVIFCEI